jgi:hypothetical protein
MSKAAKPEAGDDPELMSLRAAAKLANVPRAYLDECVAAGRLAVHLRHTSKGAKFRVTRAGLEAAGILPRAEPAPPSLDSLAQLLREQADRLAAIEEQRFQLAGQLGAALERNRLLEDRMLQLEAGSRAHESVETASGEPKPSAEPAGPSAPGSAALDAERPSNAPVQLAKRIIGAKPAPDWTPKRAATAFARLRGIVRRSSRQ